MLHGWAHDATYLDQQHPLQLAITAAVDELCAETHDHIGVDGCGAPTHAMSLLGLARAFRVIANGDSGDAGRDVYEAMVANPVMVGGERRDVTTFMREVPGLMAKDGADGVFAAALPDGRAIALKIADGANRARPPVMVERQRSCQIASTSVASRPMMRGAIASLMQAAMVWRSGRFSRCK